MSKKDWRIRVDHIAKAIKDIQSHVAGMDEIEFQEKHKKEE